MCHADIGRSVCEEGKFKSCQVSERASTRESMLEKLLKRESTHDRIWRKELSKVQQTHDGIEKFGARTVKRGLTTDRRKPAAIVKIELTRWNDKLVNGAQERRAS